MKLLVITSIVEDMQSVSGILEKAGVSVFSVSETVGHKTEQHDYSPDNWFGRNDNGTQALVYFSFTENDRATQTIEYIKIHNAANQTGFPIRAFICPVEQFGY